MGKRAVGYVVAVVLWFAFVSPGTCETIRVNLGFRNTALLEAASGSAGAVRSAAIGPVRQAPGQVALPGFCSSVSSGNPALPCKLIYVALPPDADPTSVKVLPGSYSTSMLPGSYDIAPVPAATSDSQVEWGKGKSIIGGRNALVYRRNGFYPSEHLRLVEVGNLRTWKVAVLEYWPYAYNPATGQLRVAQSDTAQLSFASKPASDSSPADPAAAEMSGFVQNRSDAAGWYGASSASASATGYAIITTSAIASASTALADFAAFQTARGFTVKIATEGDWGGGAGDGAAEHIRAWLQSNYLNLGLQYVLLIGNPDPAGDVPMKMLWPRNWSSSYREAPSDYYYSDLTGNWDIDGDGCAGEEPDDFGPGGIDQIPEVYVGRIPCYGNTVELDSILRKTMSYESTVQGDWAKSFLLAMKPMDDGTPSYQLGEEITAGFLPLLGLRADRVYDDAYGLNPAPEHYPCSYDMVQSQWSGGAGLVFWMTHGSYNTAGSVFESSRCDFLDDSKPSIVYMASCSNGQPEYSGSLGYRVLARGGASTFSASRVSWYYLGETSFVNSDSVGGLGYQYARFLTIGAETCGRAAMDARLANPVGIWPNHLVFNLYGDPSLAYKMPRSVAAAKLASDGASVEIPTCLVSRMGDGPECFVQDANRCGGMRLTGQWAGIVSLSPGGKVAVTGCLGTENGMRVLRNARVTATGETARISPLGMSNHSVGDTKNLALLVTTCGRVVSVSGSSFVISDGTLASGLRVTCHGTASAPSSQYARITGISTTDGLAVYQAGDVVGQ